MKSAFLWTARLGAGFGLLILVAACADDDNPPPAQHPAAAVVINSPARLADVDAGTFLVTDYATGAFHHIDKTTLQTRRSFRVAGQATGIALTNGLYFVGNKATRSVDVLDSLGQFLYHLGGRTGEFASVNDLAVDMRIVYVLDTKAAEVRLFYLDGTDTGATVGTGILKRPTALTLDPDSGNLLVSDFGDTANGIQPAIRIFDPAGNQIDVISDTNHFSTPQGLSVNAGYVFVVDALSGKIQIFRLADKTWIKELGSLGTGDGQLHYPLDVLVDANTKDVFVADNGNRRITVFRAGGVLP